MTKFAVTGCALVLTLTVGPIYGAPLPSTDGEYGPSPTIPPPDKSWIPTLNVAKAKPWQGGAMPHSALGTTVAALARGLQHPRWLYVLPNGDVLVAESEAPAKPDDAKGVRGVVQKIAQKRAGSGTAPSANRVTLLRDPNGDGRHVERHTFLQGLNSPIGMALVGNTLYVANTDAVVKVRYETGEVELKETPTEVVALPAGPINHHWTKSLIASPDGKKLYVGVGSNSNVGEKGIEEERDRNAVWEIDAASGAHRVFANGLRNPVGLAWQPDSKALWVSVNERDELGDHVPPDYMTAVRDGAFYGFPFSYYGQHVDDRVKPQDPAMVARANPARLCTGRAHRLTRPVLVREFDPAGAVSARHVHRSTRLVEPEGSKRLQGHLCGVRQRSAHGVADRGSRRLPGCQGQCTRSPGGIGDRQTGFIARRGRCRKHRVAREQGRALTCFRKKIAGRPPAGDRSRNSPRAAHQWLSRQTCGPIQSRHKGQRRG